MLPIYIYLLKFKYCKITVLALSKKLLAIIRLSNFAKYFIIDVRLGSKYASDKGSKYAMNFKFMSP